MKLLYVSCHQVLEYDEVKLFHELGIDVFSTGSYAVPWYRQGMIRPGIDGLPHYPELERMASTFMSSGQSLSQGLIDWADTIVFMHLPEALEKNWAKMEGKRVIFRSIGQCVGHQESILAKLATEGLEIVRYSPMEENIPNYAGKAALIRFYKDPAEYGNYTGKTAQVVNFTQSIVQRCNFTHYDEVLQVMRDIPAKIYGVDNKDLGELDGGELSFDDMKQTLRDSRVYLYSGTWPAPYTLSFIEALMTGIPIVAMGKNIAESTNPGLWDFYEIPNIIDSGTTGYVCKNIASMRDAVRSLLGDKDKARIMGERARLAAIQLFGKETISKQWKDFLCR